MAMAATAAAATERSHCLQKTGSAEPVFFRVDQTRPGPIFAPLHRIQTSMRRAMSLGADRSVFAAGKGQDVGRSGSYPQSFFRLRPTHHRQHAACIQRFGFCLNVRKVLGVETLGFTHGACVRIFEHLCRQRSPTRVVALGDLA